MTAGFVSDIEARAFRASAPGAYQSDEAMLPDRSYSAAISAQHTIALQTVLQRPKPL